MIAKAVRNIFRFIGTLFPKSDNTAKANAISVAMGIPKPCWVVVFELNKTWIRAGAIIPPIAAKTGKSAFLKVESSPIYSSRSISRPTSRKKIVNPPYPDYTSGLVGLYGPVIQVLINEFGDIPVTDDTYAWRGLAARQFNSLSQMRLEAALSRVYAGIHYKFTQLISIDMGIELANHIDKVRVVGPEYQ